MATGIAVKVGIAAISITVGAVAGVIAITAALIWTVTQRI